MKKIIWSLWFQGWHNAPELNKICLESWIHHNPDWIVVKLDKNILKDYIDLNEIPKCFAKDYAGMSDVIRILLLEKHGGVWVDSSLFCNKPLDDWIPEGTFLFDSPSRFQPIASWFIKSEPDSYIIKKWKHEVLRYTEKRKHKPTHYYWFHDQFKYLIKSDNRFRTEWNEQLKIPCNHRTRPRGMGPHYFCPWHLVYNSPITQEVIDRVESQVDPCYKFTNKYPLKENGAVDYILKDFKNKYMK